VLQDHKFSNQTACLDIEWSYKRWEHLSPSLHLFGYPENLKNKTTKINEMKYENKYIMHQDEMVCYRNTCGGESGGPLVKLSNSEKGSKIKLVGVHKGVRGNNSVGLTLNSA
jgi:V8-like Glu-specific endopeptidase